MMKTALLIFLFTAATVQAAHRSWMDCEDRYDGKCMSPRLAANFCHDHLIEKTGMCAADTDYCCAKLTVPRPIKKSACETTYGNECYISAPKGKMCMDHAPNSYCDTKGERCCREWGRDTTPSICERVYNGGCYNPKAEGPNCEVFTNSTATYLCQNPGERCCDQFENPRIPTKEEDRQCGVPTKPVGAGWRIVNGKNAQHGAWPWQVSLRDQYGGHYCGASIIDEYWIMGAAHCFRSHAAETIRVVVGAHLLNERKSTEQTHLVEKIFKHRSYNDTNNGSPNDIALVRLQTPIRFNSHVRKVCLPEHEVGYFDAYDDCHITGWGQTEGTADKNILQQLQHPSLDEEECKYRWHRTLIKPTMICIGRGESGACGGDSGGPMVCREDGIFYQVGVTSWGSKDCRGRGRPSVYTRVNMFISWIAGVQKRYQNLVQNGQLDTIESTSRF